MLVQHQLVLFYSLLMSYISTYDFFIGSNTVDKIASLPKVITQSLFFLRLENLLNSFKAIFPFNTTFNLDIETFTLNVRGQLVRLTLQLHIQVDDSKRKYIDELLYLYCSSRT
ncbi:hypothetical protein BB048_22270 [Vibrio parahaemolyticus]|nr:hypothetical protein BB048_22270 [Vibrio parahaemolyticus]